MSTTTDNDAKINKTQPYVIYTSGEIKQIQPPNGATQKYSLLDLTKLVGAEYVGIINKLKDKKCIVYDEEGIDNQKPINSVATKELGTSFNLRGTIFVCPTKYID